MKIISLFTGAGGLDLGFHNAGFETIWCNECDRTIHETIEYNFPNVKLDKRRIEKIPLLEIPYADGIIGGPPCQSWSSAGNRKGFDDPRGKMFLNYIEVLNHIKPLFFVAENVSGLLMKTNKDAFETILKKMEEAGYNVEYKVLSSMHYGVAQDRKRVFFVGLHKKLNKKFIFPEPLDYIVSLRDAIGDLEEGAIPSITNWVDRNNETKPVPNHEYSTERFSNFYLTSNRVRAWDEQSYTIRAAGRNAPCHPSAPKMPYAPKGSKNKMMFVPGSEHLYRRLTVRECARVQSFPDSFIFKYHNICNGYKMVGNAVPVKLAEAIAREVKKQIFDKKDNAIK